MLQYTEFSYNLWQCRPQRYAHPYYPVYWVTLIDTFDLMQQLIKGRIKDE